jgi:uncharacterized protein (DUF58 family)
MLTPEMLKHIRRVELRTRRLVDSAFVGSYHAAFKGRGIAFDMVRAYDPGDDVRDIDWNVTARTGEPHVKRFNEERELTVILAVDASASILFGTRRQIKRNLAAELGAVLALAAIRNNDKVGLLIFSDRIEQFIAPRKGRKHVLLLIRELMAGASGRRGTDFALGLQTLNRFLKRRAIIFLISDFLVAGEEYWRELQLLGRRHDVIAVTLTDPLEQAWPAVGLIGLEDAETGQDTWINTDAANWREQFSSQAQRFQSLRNAALARAQVDRIDLVAQQDYAQPLMDFFRRRDRQRR